jgi:hypothetical protein
LPLTSATVSGTILGVYLNDADVHMHCRRCVAWFLERQGELPIHIANLVETRDVVRYRRSPLEWAIGDHDLDIPDGYRPRLQDVAHHKSQFVCDGTRGGLRRLLSLSHATIVPATAMLMRNFERVISAPPNR